MFFEHIFCVSYNVFIINNVNKIQHWYHIYIHTAYIAHGVKYNAQFGINIIIKSKSKFTIISEN